MKVIRVTTALNFGGVEMRLQLHAKFHRKEDYELIVVALQQGGRAEAAIQSQGVRVITLGLRARIPSIAAIRRLIRLFNAERPDVVHTSGAEGNFHGLVASWLAGVPVRVGEEIGLPSHSWIAKKIFSLVYRTAHRVIGISNAVAAFLVQYEATRRKVEVVYNPIDIGSHFTRLNRNAGFVIATVCRLEQVKNPFILLDLIKALSENHPSGKFELWFIGDGSLMGALVKRSEELGIRSMVTFHGYQAHPQEIIRAANVFILPSFSEGFGLACIEAIQCSLPVIVSGSGGMVEYITDGDTGYIFDPHSLDQLISKTEQVIAMGQSRIEAMTSKALTEINSRFSPATYLSELNRIYRLISKSIS